MQDFDKTFFYLNIAASCHNVDTTPLESLPGNVDLLKQVECATNTVEKKDDNFTPEPHRQCDSDKNNSTNSINVTRNRDNSTRISSGNYKNSKLIT